MSYNTQMNSETGPKPGNEARDTSSTGSFRGGEGTPPPMPRVRSLPPDTHRTLPVREAAALHVLGHPDAAVPKALARQIDAAESAELAARVRENGPVSPQMDAALTAVEEGVDSQISGHKPLSKGQIRARRAVVAAATVAAAGYTGYQTVDNAMQVPERAVARATSEIPAEIGTEKITIFGRDFDVPSIKKTLEGRDQRVAQAQESLDDAIDGTVTNGLWTIGLILGGIGTDKLAKRGVAPVNATRRRLGSRKEKGGWASLGTTKEQMKQHFNYQRRRQ